VERQTADRDHRDGAEERGRGSVEAEKWNLPNGDQQVRDE
jgi:hypothetical protein